MTRHLSLFIQYHPILAWFGFAFVALIVVVQFLPEAGI